MNVLYFFAPENNKGCFQTGSPPPPIIPLFRGTRAVFSTCKVLPVHKEHKDRHPSPSQDRGSKTTNIPFHRFSPFCSSPSRSRSEWIELLRHPLAPTGSPQCLEEAKGARQRSRNSLPPEACVPAPCRNSHMLEASVVGLWPTAVPCSQGRGCS